MSTLGTPSTSSAQDRSLELAMTAMSAERSNRPRILILAAGLLLAIAIAYLGWGLVVSGAAKARLSKARGDYRNLESLVQQVRSNFDPTSTELYKPVTPSNVANKIQTHAESLGMPGVISSTGADIRSVNVKGYVQKQYSVNILEKDPRLLLQWLQKVVQDNEVPGMDISRVKLTPGFKLPSGAVGWNLEVTFKRWQRES